MDDFELVMDHMNSMDLEYRARIDTIKQSAQPGSHFERIVNSLHAKMNGAKYTFSQIDEEQKAAKEHAVYRLALDVYLTIIEKPQNAEQESFRDAELTPKKYFREDQINSEKDSTDFEARYALQAAELLKFEYGTGEGTHATANNYASIFMTVFTVDMKPILAEIDKLSRVKQLKASK